MSACGREDSVTHRGELLHARRLSNRGPNRTRIRSRSSCATSSERGYRFIAEYLYRRVLRWDLTRAEESHAVVRIKEVAGERGPERADAHADHAHSGRQRSRRTAYLRPHAFEDSADLEAIAQAVYGTRTRAQLERPLRAAKDTRLFYGGAAVRRRARSAAAAMIPKSSPSKRSNLDRMMFVFPDFIEQAHARGCREQVLPLLRKQRRRSARARRDRPA